VISYSPSLDFIILVFAEPCRRGCALVPEQHGTVSPPTHKFPACFQILLFLHTNTHTPPTTMPAKKTWTIEKESDLAAAFFEASKPHTAEFKEAVLANMRDCGHDVNWDLLRYVCVLCFACCVLRAFLLLLLLSVFSVAYVSALHFHHIHRTLVVTPFECGPCLLEVCCCRGCDAWDAAGRWHGLL
jgi:hypothetical protein